MRRTLVASLLLLLLGIGGAWAGGYVATEFTATLEAGSSLKVGGTAAAALTELQVVSTSAADLRGILTAQHSDGTESARMFFRKSRGTETEPTTVASGDALVDVGFYGYDGADYLLTARLLMEAEGTIATTRVPSNISLWVNTDAAPSVLTKKFFLTPDGNTVIGANDTTGTLTGQNASVPLVVLGSGSLGDVLIDAYGIAPNVRFRNAGGSEGSPSTSLNNSSMGQFLAGGWGATTSSQANQAGMSTPTSESWTDSAQAMSVTFQTTANGATISAERLRFGTLGNASILGSNSLTTVTDRSLTFGLNNNRTVTVERRTASDSAGNNLTIQASGATVGATNKDGGSLALSGGISTGTGVSKVAFRVPIAGSTGTSDNVNTATQIQVNNGHLEFLVTQGSVSSCGTSPTLTTGRDGTGKITVGTGATTSCTFTFAKAYTNAPACTVSGTGLAGYYGGTSTTTTFVITSTVSMASKVLNYHCVGLG